ncbi:helix-turn-helix transcriptional regulator [Streptomyces sp. NPDC088747]|uniref:helix-turn-helix transcriptional regulator n=1 Tax=Streptomyces sp. NPDC088747 TaxID=3365886 RepID=UPI003811B845
MSGQQGQVGQAGQRDQRHELGEFLRSRRERLRPDEVGLPTTGRRRTPGLRREELALLAGISATWYTYLEQGRQIRASEQVLTALARALRLERHEHDHLLQFAGHLRADDVEERESLTADVAAVPMLLGPNPAYIIGGNYDVLSHNPAADQLFSGLVTEEERPANFVRWTFLEPAARHVVVDWEREARGLLARLRVLAARHPRDPRYSRLVDELQDGSPEARDWWSQYDVQARHSGRKRLRRPGRGPVEYAYTAFHLAEQPEQTLVVYLESTDPASSADAGRHRTV